MDVHVHLRTGAMRNGAMAVRTGAMPNGAMPASMPRRSLTRMLLRRQECDMLMRHSYALAYATSLRDNRACARFADVGRRPATVRRPIASTPLQPLPPFVRSLVFQLMPSPTSNAVHMSVCVRTRKNRPEDCMAKFVSNKWLGALVFAGIVADKLLLL